MDIKKLTILNVILALAVIVLFIMHFTCGSCSAPAEGTNENADTDSSRAVNFTNSDGYKIAWANSDSVTKYYALAKKFEATVMEQQKLAQDELELMYNKYSKKEQALQKEAPILGQTELQMKYEELQKLQQEIMMKEQTLQNQLMNQEAMATESFLSLTEEYMQEIGSELGYDYVFSYRIGGQLIYATPGLDITDVIIEKLNAAYAQHGSD